MPTIQEQQQIKRILNFLKVKFSKEMRRSLTTRVVYGVIDCDEGENYSIRAFGSGGDQYVGTVREVTDAQSGWIGARPSLDTSEQTNNANARGPDLWIQVRETAAGIQHRLSAIHNLLGIDRENAIIFIAEELAQEDANEDWVVALVFLAEQVHFPANRQQGVKESLLRIAHAYRRSTNAGAERVVWSAIRRASSLLVPQEALLLVPFLEREGVVDARAVALKCVERLFVPAPPANQDWVRPIGDRANALAKKFLDPDIFGGGEYALLAQSAVCTLAAIGDARITEAITLTAGLNRRWLKHQLRGKLASLRSSWQSKGEPITATDAFRTLDIELMRLS